MMNDRIEQFIAYAAKFDRGFESRIVGSPPDEIAELEAIAGLPLPRAYRSYLARMGRDNGDLSLAWEANFCATDIIYAYQNEVAEGEIVVPAGRVLIGLGGMTIEEVLLAPHASDDDGEVLVTGLRSQTWLYAKGFEKLLYRVAFMRNAAKQYKNSHQFSSASQTADFQAFEEFGRQLGYEKEWFSDSAAFCASKETAALVAVQFPGAELFVNAYAESEHEALATVQQLSRSASPG